MAAPANHKIENFQQICCDWIAGLVWNPFFFFLHFIGQFQSNYKFTFWNFKTKRIQFFVFLCDSQPICYLGSLSQNRWLKLPLSDLQLLRGLKYLHSANILHRDLKPGNLLVNANCDLKICDFGLARTSTGKGQFMTEYVVTRWYRAPELLLCCDNYDTSIDVWSVGCIFAELLGRKPIFPGTECLNQLKLIINVLGTMPESHLEFIDNPKARKYIKSLPYSAGTTFTHLYPNANPLAIDLLQRMLVFDPSKRISVTEALQHPFMSPLYDPKSDPPAQVPIDLDIDEDLGEEMIREMMWREMLYYHPEEVAAANS